MIASSTIRHAPYWHLIEIDFHSSRYSRHLLAVLTNVSQRMGLQRYSELFEAYASQIGFSIRQAKQESLRLSPELVGYPTRKAYSEASFASFSPVYLSTEGSSADALHGRNLFINHCKAMDISGTEGILRCFGVIVGRIVVAWTDRNLDQEDPSDGAEKLIATTLGAFDLKGLIKEHLDQYGDEIITAILRALGEQDFQEDGPIITAIRRVGDMESCWSRDASSVFQRLCRYRRINDFGVHEPTKPAFGSRTILLALAWAKQRTQAGEVSTTYHILHQLFADMQNMRLVNEQLRILNALTLWVSCHHEQFTDLTLLETLLVGGTRIMSHVELATGAQSLLSWAFELYRQVETVLPAFPHVLLSISGIIHSYCSSVEKATKEKGDILIQWVHGELLQLCQEHDIKEQILQKVLPAWPFELDKDLSVMLELLPRHIAEILEDSRLTANMFHVVRSMRALAEEDPDYANQFSKSDFWRLKDSIPPANQLQVQDVHSLAELLVRVQGQIVSNPIFNHNSQSIRFRHLQISKVEKESRAQTVASLTHKPIVSFLRSKLSDPSGKMARSTYDTIRHLISVVRPSDENFNTWASEHRQELCYLSAFPRHSSASSPAQLNDLKEKTDYLTTISDFDSWVTKLAGLLCNVVASEDPFFTSLVPYVNHQPSVAEDILPVLIHAILLGHYHGKEKSKTRVVLSEYLTSVVQADAACEATIQAVVDIVMHLRYFNIPNSSHPLSYNLWLEMDFTVLVRAALRCGAYTTALLFLELRAEHNEGSKDQGGLEDIYYDVYSHIDEPDGFYGVQSNDLQQFLFRRFQHENEWDKAFRFYGASVEAQPANVTSTHGAITSLHSFGFHRLAMIMSNQGISSGLGAPMSADLSYELGWRTGIWDLPDVSERNCSSSALYSALRAVHRDTSISSIDSIVESSLKAEVEQLRLLGSENLLGIRGVLRNIMCLRQVAEWQQAKHATLDLHIPWHARDSVMSGTQFK
jgi:ataxia telangiectasia mutated family protein